MKAVINDVSFEYEFLSKEEAIEAFHQWLNVCIELEKDRVGRVQEFYGNAVDATKDIAPDYKIIQLVQAFQDREQRTKLLGILMNSRSFDVGEKRFLFDGKESRSGVLACEDGILISLLSNVMFAEETVEGTIGKESVVVDNISKEKHIDYHADKLGIRYYEKNRKHGRKSYVRSGGVKASEMDLEDDIAQQVLDAAIDLDGRLYGCYEGKYYEFRKTGGNTYHGFRNSDLSKDEERRIAHEIDANHKI
jgi:hypothetical protein